MNASSACSPWRVSRSIRVSKPRLLPRHERSIQARSASDTLDTIFGTKGEVITDLGSDSTDWAYVTAVDTSGRILVAGNTNASGTTTAEPWATAKACCTAWWAKTTTAGWSCFV